MAKFFKKYLSAIIISTICGILFIGIGYLYISAGIKETKTNQESVPYAPFYPENAGILFEIGDSKTVIYLNFEDESITYLNAENSAIENDMCCGYKIDYTISSNLDFLANFIDIMGGIELEKNGGNPLNYTGTQVLDIIYENNNDSEIQREIASAIFQRISVQGLTRSDFSYIIQYTSTSLSIPDCYYWDEYISDMCQNAYFVN